MEGSAGHGYRVVPFEIAGSNKSRMATGHTLVRTDHATRYLFLDGLRGWAALIVMLTHVFIGSLPFTDPGPWRLDLWWSFTGNYMVSLFFAVSGFALSIKYVSGGTRHQLLAIIGGRYFRLMIPVAATCALVSICLNFGLFLEPGARTPDYREHLLFDPTLGHLAWFAFYGVFFDFIRFDTYAGPLWTMAIEMLGSYGLLLLLLVAPNRRWRLIFLSVVVSYFFVIESFYSLFFIGALVADLYVFLDRTRRSLSTTITTMFLVGAYILNRIAPYSPMMVLVSVTFWFVGSIFNPWMRTFLESGFSQFLGRISFPLYLLHEAAIIGAGMPAYLAATTTFERFLASSLAASASVALALLFLPIERASKFVAHLAGRWFAAAIDAVWRRMSAAFAAGVAQ